MPIVAVDGFLDAVPVAITTANVTWPIPGTPYLGAGNTTSQLSTMNIARNGDWLECTGQNNASGSTAVKSGAVYRPLADILTFTTDSYVYGGVRFKRRTAYEPSYAYPLVSFAHTSSPATTVIALANNEVPNATIDKEYYFEWAIDGARSVIKRRLDGVDLPDVAIDAAHSLQFRAQNKSICFGVIATSVLQRYNCGVDVKDIYYGYRAEGETATWLGDVRLVPLPVSELPAPWTGSDGAGGSMTALAAVNTPVTSAATYAAPYAVSDAGLTEVSVKLDTSAVVGKIHGIFATASANRAVGTTGKLNHVIDADGATVTSLTPNLTTAITYYPLKFMAKSPAGQPWTKQKLADMTVKLSIQ